MEDKVILTQEGYNKLVEELEDLKVNKRAEIADEIREAKAQGDLSENYEYTAAKEAQADLEARIAEIEHIINHVEIIEDNGDNKTVNVGSTVSLKNVDTDEKEEYTIVGSTEADPFEGKISNESPLGKELLGKKKNQEIKFVTPAEEVITYKILKIQ